MDKALYIAMAGAKHNMLSQTAHANNLANVNTDGFKADFAQARSMPVYYGDGSPSRAYALTENPGTDFSQGALVETGRSLDIAINNQGFIAVQGNDGTEAYSRAGSMNVDSVGILRTSNGLPVLGNGGFITIPPHEKVEIGLDGTISIIPAGQGADQVAVIDRIKLVNPDTDLLKKNEDGLHRFSDPEGPQIAEADANVRVTPGFVEASNVNAVGEMISMLELSRQYEMQVKLMQSAKQNSEASAKLLQMQ